eukprot:sb/3470158/
MHDTDLLLWCCDSDYGCLTVTGLRVPHPGSLHPSLFIPLSSSLSLPLPFTPYSVVRCPILWGVVHSLAQLLKPCQSIGLTHFSRENCGQSIGLTAKTYPGTSPHDADHLNSTKVVGMIAGRYRKYIFSVLASTVLLLYLFAPLEPQDRQILSVQPRPKPWARRAPHVCAPVGRSPTALARYAGKPKPSPATHGRDLSQIHSMSCICSKVRG